MPARQQAWGGGEGRSWPSPLSFICELLQTYTEAALCVHSSPPRSICLPTCLNTEGAKRLPAPSSSSSSHLLPIAGGSDGGCHPRGDKGSQGGVEHLIQRTTTVQRRSGAEVHLKPPFWTLSPGKGAEHPRFSLFQTSPINQMCGLG